MTVRFDTAPPLIRSTLGGGQKGQPKLMADEAVVLDDSPKTAKPKRKTSNKSKRKSWQITQPSPERTTTGSIEWNLLDATEFSLVKKKRDQLAKMCDDRGLLVQVRCSLACLRFVRQY